MGKRLTGIYTAMIGLALLAPTPAISQSGPAAASVKPRTKIPLTRDGHPDFTGVWAGPGFSHQVGPNDTEPIILQRYPVEDMAPFGGGGRMVKGQNIPPFVPGGEAILKPKPTGDLRIDDGLSQCLPVGIPRSITGPFAQQWVQTPGSIAILYEWFHQYRYIPLDGRPHDPEISDSFFGDSVGHWEGDTLVIDTVGLKAWTLDETQYEHPLPNTKNVEVSSRWHSDALHLIERIRYTSPNVASYSITIDDPKIWTKPWTWDSSMTFHPTWKILEMICEENNRCTSGKCEPSDVQKKASK